MTRQQLLERRDVFHLGALPTWRAFCTAFRDALIECHVKHPANYTWVGTEREEEATRRLLHGYWHDTGISYEGRAIKRTIRQLVGHVATRKAVRTIVDTAKARGEEFDF